MALLRAAKQESPGRASQRWRWPGLLCLVLALLPVRVSGQTQEYEVKAAFLYHFTQFVEWPAEAFESTNSPIVIGILGSNPFGEKLEALVRGERIQGRELVVRQYRSAQAAREAHILFISQSEEEDWPGIWRVLGGRPILTVSDLDNFERSGGMVRFYNRENKVRLLINHQNARNARLTLSSKLLRVADVIERQ